MSLPLDVSQLFISARATMRYAQFRDGVDYPEDYRFHRSQFSEFKQEIARRLAGSSLLSNRCVMLLMNPTSNRLTNRVYRQMLDELARDAPLETSEGPWGLYAYDGDLVYVIARSVRNTRNHDRTVVTLFEPYSKDILDQLCDEEHAARLAPEAVPPPSHVRCTVPENDADIAPFPDEATGTD